MKPEYDLNAMGFVPEQAYLRGGADLWKAFIWGQTPEGHSFWERQHSNGMTHAGCMAINAMLEQYEKEQGIVRS